jgi:NitT/TauT family transport system ATP-binding protein
LHKPDNYTQAFGSSSQQKAFANEIAGFSAYMPDRSLLLGKSSMKLSFENVEKRFSDLSVVNDFSYEVEEGKLIALVGPSGCGPPMPLPSARMRPPLGFSKPAAICSRVDFPHPERTLMFQENALYPWLTLVRNVAFALELQKVDKRDALKQARAWLEKVNLSGFEDYYPHQVSGGMRQRAALARAFISHPKVLLLDEPFGAVDALTRLTLQDALLQLIQEERPTVLLVTHDVDEALFLADRILVFSPRPTRVLKEFNLQRYAKSHDLSQYSGVRREILALLGIHAVQEEFIKRNEEVVI